MRIIISGAGAVGAHLAKMLSQEKHDIVLLDPNENRLRQVGSNVDLLTLTGSGTSFGDLANAQVKRADLLIAVAKNEETNIASAILGKRLGAKKTIARIDNQEYLFPNNIDHFLNLGIDYLIYPEKLLRAKLLNLLAKREVLILPNLGTEDLLSMPLNLAILPPLLIKTCAKLRP